MTFAPLIALPVRVSRLADIDASLVLIALLYGLAAAMCLGRAQAAPGADARRGWRRLGLGLVILVTLRATGGLAIITDLGRALAAEQGWYDARRPLQAAAIVACGVLAAIGVAWWRRQGRATRARAMAWAEGGAAALVGLFVLRLVSLHQVEWMLGLGVGHATLNVTLEVAALALLVAAAAAAGDRSGCAIARDAPA